MHIGVEAGELLGQEGSFDKGTSVLGCLGDLVCPPSTQLSVIQHDVVFFQGPPLLLLPLIRSGLCLVTFFHFVYWKDGCHGERE